MSILGWNLLTGPASCLEVRGLEAAVQDGDYTSAGQKLVSAPLTTYHIRNISVLPRWNS
jgi:hypothetical protein